MRATVVDLRYRMSDVLKALERNEEVTILHRGKPKGVIKPLRGDHDRDIRSHPFFGMTKSRKSVDEIMEELRGGRCRDL